MTRGECLGGETTRGGNGLGRNVPDLSHVPLEATIFRELSDHPLYNFIIMINNIRVQTVDPYQLVVFTCIYTFVDNLKNSRSY